MLFSVIIPAFNAEQCIRKCLDSILAQTFSDFEVIVINDGSSDDTLKILKNYSIKDSRINVFSFPNSGVGISRRRGVFLAQGKYIIFVDSDDSINPELLQELAGSISSLSPHIIRYQCNIINDNEAKNHERYNYHDSGNLRNGLETLKLWSTYDKKYAVYWLFCFKKTVFTHVLFVPKLKCYEDVALIPLLIASVNSVLTINYVGYNYSYGNSESLTNLNTLSAERARAYDFISAYDFAIKNFIKLDNVSSSDIAFFISDYNKRLIGKYNSLSEVLKKELKPMFSSRVNL